MTKFTRIALVVGIAAVVSACEAQCSVSTASLSDATMASAVDPETKMPVTAATTFPADSGNIYATAKVSNAPADTKVKVTFHYLEDGEQQITDAEVTAAGTRYVMFTLSPPTAGWPVGKYETRFYLNGEESTRVSFSVQAPPLVETIAAPASNKVWRDEVFGYALELPDTWAYRVTPAKDYLFEGPKGTDAYELSIILQFVTKSANPRATAETQLQGLVTELEQAAKAVVKRRDTLRLSGVAAPFVTVAYDAKNSAGQIVPFAHTQLAAEHGAYFYLISYSGPVKTYEAHVGVFEHMLETFKFTAKTLAVI